MKAATVALPARGALLAASIVGVLASSTAFAQSNAHLVGRWSGVQQWPIIAIHASLMPDGRVLAWDSTTDDFADPVNGYGGAEQNTTRVTLWDPVSNRHTRVDSNTQSNLFCSGHAHLPSGRLFAAGGNINGGQGIAAVNIFDFRNRSWLRVQDMAQGRWYPSVTPLANGEMLVTSGFQPIPEVWTNDGHWRTLSGANQELSLYPWQMAAPNGRVFHAGPESTMRYLNTAGAGSWETVAERDSEDRNYGGHAMYDVGKILVAGGGGDRNRNLPSLSSAVTIDLNNGTSVAPTRAMNFGRRQHNITILPDGSVLATGGNSNGAENVDENAAVMAAEVWNPSSGEWTVLASMQVTRQYHSTALLLADGRVLSAGGGFCGGCNPAIYQNKNAEIFSPPYLFNKDGSGGTAPRPRIDWGPGRIRYGEAFWVGSPQASSIQKAALVRLSSVTHSNNMEQRYVPLTFNRWRGVLQINAPANQNIAPPGYYMLFLVDSNGVPSIARMLRIRRPSISDPSPDPVEPTTPVTPIKPPSTNRPNPSPLG